MLQFAFAITFVHNTVRMLRSTPVLRCKGRISIQLTFNIFKFDVLWPSNPVSRHPTPFTTIQEHYTWWPEVYNMLNSTMLNSVEQY